MKQRYTVGLFFVLLFLLLVLCISSFWMRHRKPAKMVDPYFYQSEEEAEDIENTSKTVFTQDVINSEGYYILYKGEDISVYYSDKQTVYFTTDLTIEDIPAYLLEKLREGIYMETEEDMYHFLESYSS